ncbi:cytochrome c-L [Methylophilus rhizosphaerae]|uniref:Cytochrome c-L n=1 Tax=Methylophilus rhizosphaerae TaxID=492660 RepID=A0A1G9EQI7_9PROT|nr:c-type cytochrome [Methylophilus rhizosphaerae]SDK78275.1 cytochrome c-L [Methylophilus rhizosphaerae]
MNRKLALATILTLVSLTACHKSDSGSGSSASAGDTASSGEAIKFVKTQDGSPLEIKPELFDTPAAKEFLASGKNPYVGKEDAIKEGKKIFQLYSCTQCHGPDAGGQVGPALTGPNYHYAKDATNKGMFETVWNGTNGGMGAKGKGLMDPTDPNNGITPDELLKVIAWVRSHGQATGNEDS